jgi:predicted RNase H-like nuclease (RuvC/YqgF family)
MSYFDQILDIVEGPKEHRLGKLDQLIEKIAKKDILTIKKILQEVTDELEAVRLDNQNLVMKLQEIDAQIGKVVQKKNELKEAALDCKLEDFNKITDELNKLNYLESELFKRKDEVGQPEQDSEVDKQKLNTYCENWGNQFSIIDSWGAACYKLKLLLASKLDE